MILDYIGKVKLIKSASDGSILKEVDLKNSGTSNLFKFFINCLMGNLDSRAVPAFIDMRYEQEVDLDNEKKTVITPITIDAGTPILSTSSGEAVYDDGNKYLSAFFAASFSKFDFIDPELFKFYDRFVYLTITGSDKTIELTRLRLEEQDYREITTLDDDQKVTIEWNMIIKNSESETEHNEFIEY